MFNYTGTTHQRPRERCQRLPV